MADTLLVKTLIIIVASVCAVGLVARIRLPPAIGYMAAGLVVGPHGLQLLTTATKPSSWRSSASSFSCSWWGLNSLFPQ
jgi:Kef-type K+ transport system membrane component KefB